MQLNRSRSLRTRLSVAGLNIFARLARTAQRREEAGRAQNQNVTRIVVLELWNIGDVILAMPFLAQLRGLFPRAEITLVSRPVAAELLTGTGLVDKYIPAELSWSTADRTRFPKKAVGLWRLSRRLQAENFDIAFSARSHLREHALLAFSGARRKVGIAISDSDKTLTDAILSDGQSHRVNQWMRLLQPFGGAVSLQIPRLHLAEPERQLADEFLASRGIGKGDLVIGIHPGASLPEKRWPLSRFREVAATLVTEPGVHVLAFAEPAGYGSELFAIPGVIGAQVGLRGLVALVDRCDLLVCNDSGPMHIAAALGVPTVAMFGREIERWFAPLGEDHEMLTSKDDNSSPDVRPREAGIRAPIGISTAQVLEAVDRVLRRLPLQRARILLSHGRR
jgi:heptosyltransferase-2